MYGKTYESMYEGSMIGAGINVFAVWNYIITKARGGHVEVNPKLLAFTLGGKEEEIESALEFLMQPDETSRSKLEGGRRIIKEGQFQYRLVNWEHYQRIKNLEDQREYNRGKQAEYRLKRRGETETIPEKIRRQVENDPQTISDRESMRRHDKEKKAKAAQNHQPTTTEKEYDLDHESNP
jgi:hypothetical protein